MQRQRDQLGQVLQLFVVDQREQATAQRGARVMAEVVPVALTDRFQQQVDLELLEILSLHAGRPSQTRSMASSASSSIGLVTRFSS